MKIIKKWNSSAETDMELCVPAVVDSSNLAKQAKVISKQVTCMYCITG